MISAQRAIELKLDAVEKSVAYVRSQLRLASARPELASEIHALVEHLGSPEAFEDELNQLLFQSNPPDSAAGGPSGAAGRA